VVDFAAQYILGGMKEKHRDGEVTTQTMVRVEPKIGRNNPCPCGSGKIDKKCCGLGV
jgi:uncharacterized protein YecA (UPF0149 family)